MSRVLQNVTACLKCPLKAGVLWGLSPADGTTGRLEVRETRRQDLVEGERRGGGKPLKGILRAGLR